MDEQLVATVERITREVLAALPQDPRAATLQLRTCAVPFVDEGAALTEAVAALRAHGLWPTIVLPRWARSVVDAEGLKAAGAELAWEGEGDFCADRLAKGVEVVVLPAVPEALSRHLAVREPASLTARLVKYARRHGKRVWAIAPEADHAGLRDLGLEPVSRSNLGAIAGAELDCHGCPTQGACAVRCPGRVSDIVGSGAARFGGSPSEGASFGQVGSKLARMIDHTLLKAEATEAEVTKLCTEARAHSFASVCVNPAHVALSARLLKGSPVKVCTVVGFPLGATSSEAKAFEAAQAVKDGAHEVDMVINVGALKGGDLKRVEQDIRAVVQAVPRAVVTKVILETALLSDAEKVAGCQAAKAAGADFVKTSTGFSTGGATAADIALMRRVVGPSMGVKASGGVRDLPGALAMVKAGASRIGASASVSIVKGARAAGSGY